MVALVTLLVFFETLRSSTIAKRSILDVRRGSQYASESIGPKSLSFVRSRDE